LTATRHTRTGDGAPQTRSGERVGAPDEHEAVDPAQRLAHAFKGAMAAVRRMRGRETRRPGELSDAQYGLLFSLCERHEMSSGELATAADLSPASVTEMLDSLAAAGLVERLRSVRDRRVVLTSLTERGRGLVEERRARFEPRYRRALGGFSDDELLTAAAVLERLRELFDEPEETEQRL
jgi:DNA-binding MarR family transcriptional regulator